MNITATIKDLASVDILGLGKQNETFVGRPFYLDYDKALLLVADSWKKKVGGIPQGTFLLAYYENETNVSEALLLRALKPTKLPTDSDVICSIVEYYKDNLKTAGNETQLDDFTRYEFSFSGLECRILGTFYKDKNEKTVFGADVENFYSAHNYSVYKPIDKNLEIIANLRNGSDIPGNVTDVKIGKVRYSSSIRFQESFKDVPVYISPNDFLGKRTALFGMTRTGKSNTVKKIIQATVEISTNAESNPVGQIIFDVNGEYANANLQDEGTAIFELFKENVIRYSVLEKAGFNVLKVNFYNDIIGGFELVKSHMSSETGDYVKSVVAIDLSEPKDNSDHSSITRYERKKAAYLCCLYKAGFEPPMNFKVKFKTNKELKEAIPEVESIEPSKGISLKEASDWFAAIWDNYTNNFFSNYATKKGREWADEDLKALLVFLTRKKAPNGSATYSGYRKLRDITNLHTDTEGKPFETEIIEELKNGKIVIIDLSQGDPEIQRLYSERICSRVFFDSMENFTKNQPNNFIQFYFEEAHNLFPKKDDKDLSQIYNRIAKEGAKLNLGLLYATQEVSSISSNILKNTQNWFIAHLNNDDEIRELKKYYDFADFSESLIRFSSSMDKGFVRMKTYSNPFVIPVQIDRFSSKKES